MGNAFGPGGFVVAVDDVGSGRGGGGKGPVGWTGLFLRDSEGEVGDDHFVGREVNGLAGDGDGGDAGDSMGGGPRGFGYTCPISPLSCPVGVRVR